MTRSNRFTRARVIVGKPKMMLFDLDTEKIRPPKSLRGTLVVPGDKSISHRYALLAALAEGVSEFRGYSSSRDCQSTLECLRKLGVRTVKVGETVKVEGRGLEGLRAPHKPLDAENSGSTIRMMSGILAGQNFKSVIKGDASLSRRPMSRIIQPLEQMGAQITSAKGGRPPLEFRGGPLRPLRYELPIPSAQVKSAILFAGLLATGETQVIEPVPTRDHTEIALEQFEADIGRHRNTISLQGWPQLKPQQLRIPGDISSAAFLTAAALLVPDSDIVLQNVGLNPTRTALLDLLVGAGAYIKILNIKMIHGELVGDLHAQTSRLKDIEIQPEMVPTLIDELPILAVLGTQTEAGFRVRGAGELRVKESDRIRGVADNLRRMGAEVDELPDGLGIPGRQRLHGAEIDPQKDHRIAMAFAVAGLIAEGPTPTTIRDSGCVRISFPGFFNTLKKLSH